MTGLFVDNWWLEFQSKYLSICVGFLHTVVCIVQFGFGVHLVSKKGILPSLSGHSIVNFYVVIHIINMVEQDVHLVFFSYAEYIIHLSFPPWCGDGVLWFQSQFFKIIHVDICYDW